VTVPENIIFPLHTELLRSNKPEDLEKYMREFVSSLQEMYEQLAYGINGDIRSDTFQPNQRWTPIVKDTANSGTTFTYDHQTGWVYRQGIITDVWCDVQWTANSGAITGNMYIELPYKVSLTNNIPFVGVVQPSVFAFTGGTACVANAISNTYRAEIWNTGTGFTTANQGSVSAGRIIMHLRYIGVSIER